MYIYFFKNLALNNQQCLICHKPNQINNSNCKISNNLQESICHKPQSTNLITLNKKVNFLLNQRFQDHIILEEHYIIKADIIMYYLLPNSTEFKFYNQKYK